MVLLLTVNSVYKESSGDVIANIHTFRVFNPLALEMDI